MAVIRNGGYPLKYLKNDVIAGVVVFLVAIPLCLGVALASGAPLFAGIIAGIIGGIVVGAISQSPVSVSGPAAGMVAVVLAAINILGGFNVFLMALMFAGVLQILIGWFRAGFIADYFPSNVIQGLLCAIGILIIIKQLPFAITYTESHTILIDLLKDASGNFDMRPLQEITGHINYGAVVISILSLAVFIFLDNTKNTFLKSIPAPILIVIMGAVINEIYAYAWPNLSQINNELVNIPVHNGLTTLGTLLQFPAWDQWNNPNIYLYGVMLSAVASLEALLNLEAIEKLDKERRYCSRNRELVAQGIGNVCSGLVGGIPITSVVVRSSVNVQTGAKTKLATIIHGLLILIAVVLVPHWLNLIPLSSLAIILIYVGYKLTKCAIYKEMYEQGIARFVPFVITVIAILSTNLLTGTLIGLFFSFFFILKDNSQIQLDIINEKHIFGEVKRLILPQHMSFLRKAALVAELDVIPKNSHLIIDARNTKYIDLDILEVLNVFMNNQAPSKNIALNMLGFKKRYEIHNHIDFLNVTTYDTQASLTPDKVLEILKEGNKRFVNDQRINRSVLDEIRATSRTQHPVAIVLSCIDSRVPVETIFDMGMGDVFVARIAGNVVNDDILASIEFACHVSGAKLIVVLGHTACGAIKAACDGDSGGHLSELLNKIKVAIETEDKTTHDRTSHNASFVMNVTKLNVKNSAQKIFNNSNIINRLVREKEVGIVSAVYDVKSGMVEFAENFYTN